MKRLSATGLVLALALAAGSASASQLTVYSVNYPLHYFAQRIGGEAVEAVFQAPADGDPAYWVPDAETVAAYQSADLILLNGAGYAAWVQKVSLSKRRQINTSRSFRDVYIPLTEQVTHTHGPGGEHEHTGYAFTIWLDFDLAAKQAEAVAQALTRATPEQAEAFEARYGQLATDLSKLDSATMAAGHALAGAPLIGSHPVYQYLARRYELNIRSVHWEPDQEPTTEQWSELRHLWSEHPARWMIWEAEPLATTREQLESMGIEVLVFDPCGNRPAEGDWLAVMQANVRALAAARRAP